MGIENASWGLYTQEIDLCYFFWGGEGKLKLAETRTRLSRLPHFLHSPATFPHSAFPPRVPRNTPVHPVSYQTVHHLINFISRRRCGSQVMKFRLTHNRIIAALACAGPRPKHITQIKQGAEREGRGVEGRGFSCRLSSPSSGGVPPDWGGGEEREGVSP